MSDLSTRPPGDLAAGGEPRKRSPLRLLPAEWRKPALFFFEFHSDLLKSPVGVVTRLRMWMKDDGLTLDEALSVMRRLMQPDRCAGFQYAGQLLAEMARLVADATKTRRAREEQEQRRRDDEAARQSAAPAAAVRAILAGVGTGGGGA